jgi:hypothetical protein
MNLETNNIHIEKNLCFTYGISYLDYWKKNKNLIINMQKKFFDQNTIKNLKNTNIIYVDKDQFYFKTADFFCIDRNCSQYYYQYESFLDLNYTETEKNLEQFINLRSENLFINKRRRRRKFLTDDERRMARILKNRRTAEESRQRRIQKMKQLENLVISYEEREKKLKEEICYLGKENASQTVELLLLKKGYQKI